MFDWAWADAYRRHGLDYYPKLTGAIPFTPVPGPRLLATTHEQRLLLLRGIEAIAREAGLSSAHLLFLDAADQAAAVEAGWSMRSTVQFHWRNRAPEPYADFADFLAGLQRDEAQEDPAGTAPRRRRRRPLHRGHRAAPSAPTTGPSSTAATPSPTGRITPRPT